MANSGNKHAIIGVSMVVVVMAGIYGYFKYAQYYPSTDDAYVNSNLVNVAPKIAGYLSEINITNNQLVHKGDVLFKLNPVDYDLSYDQAAKNYTSYDSQVAMAKQQLEVQKGVIATDKANYNLALQTANRYATLYKANTIAKQAYQNAMTDLANAKTKIDIDQQKLAQYQNMVQYTEAKKDQAKSSQDAAKTNLGYTSYTAPVDGYISNLGSLSSGEFISAGQQIFGIVDDSQWWIDANFKETQLNRIKPGQKVEVELDMYDHKYQGVVKSISYASGNTFSLLPPQNATGNWVKVTQRFTVRIELKDDAKFPLRVGASANVKINTL